MIRGTHAARTGKKRNTQILVGKLERKTQIGKAGKDWGRVISKLHLIELKVHGKVDWFQPAQHKARDGRTIGHSLTIHIYTPAPGTHMV